MTMSTGDFNIVPENNYFLSRHWEAESNIKKILAHTVETWESFPLTSEWIRQATEEAVNTIIKFDIIVTSPILRVRQTAQIYQKYLWWDIHIDDRLIERNDGVFDGKSLDDYLEWYHQKERDLTVESPENWENHTDVKNRVIALLRELNTHYTGKNILLVSHGTPCAIIQKVWNWEDLPTKNDWLVFPKNTIIALS